MEDAIEEAIKELNWAYIANRYTIQRQDVVAILDKFYNARTQELSSVDKPSGDVVG